MDERREREGPKQTEKGEGKDDKCKDMNTYTQSAFIDFNVHFTLNNALYILSNTYTVSTLQ